MFGWRRKAITVMNILADRLITAEAELERIKKTRKENTDEAANPCIGLYL